MIVYSKHHMISSGYVRILLLPQSWQTFIPGLLGDPFCCRGYEMLFLCHQQTVFIDALYGVCITDCKLTTLRNI